MTLTTNRLLVLGVVAALAFLGWRLAARPATGARDEVADSAAALVSQPDAARFTVAQANLMVQRQTAGTYAGAAMPEGMTLVRADVQGYCAQLDDRGTISHVDGPTSRPVAGPCA